MLLCTVAALTPLGQVKNELNKQLTIKRQALSNLGPKRETSAEQAAYLQQMSMCFRDVATMALNAQYTGSPWFDTCKNSRIATTVVNRNEMLSVTIEHHGQSYRFDGESSHASATEFDSIIVREIEVHEDLEDLLLGEEEIDAHIGEDILKWLDDVYKGSRGFELGVFDSSILATTMKTQSAKWEPIALGYIADIVSMVHVFIEDLLRLVCPDDHIRAEITSKLIEKLTVKYNGAIDHVRFLLGIERAGTPATLNHYFNDNLEKW